MPNSLPELARQAVEHFVRTAQRLPLPETGLASFREQSAGIFVTLQDAHKQLRGCIGTISPNFESILAETIQNAISAATRDPRFRPVRPEELDTLHYSVSVLHAPEAIPGPEALDPKRYGVIVVARGGRRGLLLPDLEGIDHAEQQLRHAMHKGGIFPGEAVQLFRFQVDKYE
ncbi:MAG: AmmeMemoRadiSam system protein A [Candidatus Sericytochromatia bacterium]